MNPITPAIDIAGLTHQYEPAGKPALDDLSLNIAAGTLFGILGPNGGGKTTLFRILTTLLRPTRAQHVRLLGHDVLTQPQAARTQLGVVFQMPSLDGQLTVRENLQHHGHLFGLCGRELEQRINESLAHFGLTDRTGDLTGKLSGGQRRRVEIAKALLPKPRLLLLDEPSTGLDPAARRDLWQLLRDLHQQSKVTVILTTHFMEEADRCHELAVLHEGKLVRTGSPASLKSNIGGDVITFTPTRADDAVMLVDEITTRFGPWSEQTQPKLIDGVIRLEHNHGAQLAATITSTFTGRITALSVSQPTLEDVFLHATGRRFDESVMTAAHA